jgi:hypothetical protein
MFGFEPWISCIASCTIDHYATSVHSMVITLVNTRYISTTLASHGTCWLVSDVGRGSSRAPGSGHDVRVTGPDIN